MKEYDIEFLSQIVQYNHDKYLAFKNQLPFEINKEYEKILQARYQKVSRIKKRLLYLLIRYRYIWFCTFTINDKFYNKCERTRRDFLKQFLNSHDFKYILNVDYGKKTERKHYHCIIATNIDFDVNQYFQNSLNNDFGWSLCKPVIKGNDDLKKVTKYIDKLWNHCTKASTKRERMLYNFKGYDKFCPDSASRTIQYKLEYELFNYVSLLDKADITGNLEV